MELIELEKIAERENIDLINYKMNKNKAKIINYDSCNIFMDYSKISTYTEEKCLLAEELGHYYYDAYYTLSSDKSTIERQEYRAFKWKSLSLVSLADVKECFFKGLTNYYDIAEYLQVQVDMVEFAINYYKDNGQLFTEEENAIYSI